MAIGLKAGDVMSTGAATVRPDASLAEAARILVEHRISGLPVIGEQGDLVGILTERDFLTEKDGSRPRWLDMLLSGTASQTAAGELQNRSVKDIMSKNPFTVDVDAPVEKIFDVMESRGIKRLPVLHDGKVVGIVSRADLLRVILQKAG
jgi:CBS domain-containing protein